jgi:hypothetical protein
MSAAGSLAGGRLSPARKTFRAGETNENKTQKHQSYRDAPYHGRAVHNKTQLCPGASIESEST